MRVRWDQYNKRWEASVGSGKGRRWIRSKKEGEEGRLLVEARLEELLHGPAPLPPGSLAEFIEQTWWPTVKIDTTIATRQLYKSIITNHFGSLEPLRMDSLRQQALQQWVAQLSVGRSPKTVRNCFGLLAGILEMAWKSGRVGHQDWRLVRLPKVTRQRREGLTQADQDSLIKAAAGGPMAGPIFAASFLGLRRNEVCGLKRPHVRILTDRAIVEVSDNRQTHGEEARLKSKAPGETRRLVIPKEWGERLLSFAPPDSLYLFLGDGGAPIHPNVITRSMPALCEAAGLPPTTFHDLRHAAAGSLRRSGVPETLIKDILGHTSVDTTLIYLDQQADEMLAAFGRLGSV